MKNPVRIGVIDSGASPDQCSSVIAWRDFTESAPPERLDDAIGHGTEIIKVVRKTAPHVELLCARAFGEKGATSADRIACALDWLCEERVDLVTMSFGLTADRPVLEAACRKAFEAGILLVASAPAMGAPSYPAAYECVISSTGDARCQWGDVSDLSDPAGQTVRFGTWCASPEQVADPAMSGASLAAAHFSGLAAMFIADHAPVTSADAIAHFRRIARFKGAERRTSGDQSGHFEPAQR